MRRRDFIFLVAYAAVASSTQGHAQKSLPHHLQLGAHGFEFSVALFAPKRHHLLFRAVRGVQFIPLWGPLQKARR